MILSTLKNAQPGTVTYYTGDDSSELASLKDCTLICKRKFGDLKNVDQIIVDDPQLYFYKLSNIIANEYKFTGKNIHLGENSDIHKSCVIGDNVTIGNNVSIGPNTVIYSKTSIGDATRIDANVTLGTPGMMWVWDSGTKIFLQQLGGLSIGKGCIIGSNCAVVRGSANENTIIEDYVNMAPGCNIGHGTVLRKNVHLANNVTIGGSVVIEKNNFIGCGAVINPGVEISAKNTVIGGGATVVKSLDEEGVYFGVPAKRAYSKVEGKLSGIPLWV